MSLHPGSSYRVHLVDEDNARRVLSRHYEQLSHHSRSLSDVLLHQLRTADPDERAVRVMRDGPS